MESLIELAAAHVREEGGTGSVELERNKISKLRQAIDAAVGDGAGAELIVTGAKREYCLCIDAKDWKKRVAITPCFSELVRIKMLSSADFDLLRRHCRNLTAREAEKLLSSA